RRDRTRRPAPSRWASSRSCLIAVSLARPSRFKLPWRMSPLVHRDTLRLFPTLVGSFAVDDAPGLAQLAALVLARAERTPTVARGERTGWQSANDFLDWNPHSHALGALFGEAVASMMPAPPRDGVYLTAWANVLRRGDYFT